MSEFWGTFQNDVVAILDSVHQRMVDNSGLFAPGTTCDALPATATNIASASGVDLCDCLVATYLAAMPYDPSASGASYTSCSAYDSGYTIYQDASTGRITVAAPSAEIGQVISVTR